MRYLIFPLFIFLTYSCTGTIESAVKEKTTTKEFNNSQITFDGVSKLRGISHKKIEVYFKPAMGGSGKYNYRIYAGGNPIPVSVSSDILEPNLDGDLMYTLTGLDAATSYIIRIDVQDDETGNVKQTGSFLTASTYQQQVVDFAGISSVSNLGGVEGTDSIKVRWSNGSCSPPGLCSLDSDPIRYEIIVLQDSEGARPVNADDQSITEEEGRFVKIVPHDESVNETIVRGLQSGELYHVVVRAIHRGSVESLNDPKLRSELNLKYLSIKTLDGNDLEFDSASLSITKLMGSNSQSGLRAGWEAAIGIFYEHRLFYRKKGAGIPSDLTGVACKTNPESGDPDTVLLCKKVFFNENNVFIGGLLPQTTYEFVLILCKDPACNDYVRFDMKEQTTGSSAPNFQGVSSVRVANDISEAGSVFLEFTAVDRGINYIDGYDILVKSDLNVGTVEENILSFEDRLNPSDLYYFSYDLDTLSGIRIGNIEYYSSETYCFKVIPYVYIGTSQTKQVYENSIWSCVGSLIYKAPSLGEFIGFTNDIDTDSGTAILKWEKPTGGFYDYFEIYYYIGTPAAGWLADVVNDSLVCSGNCGVIDTDGDEIIGQDGKLEHVISGVTGEVDIHFGIVTRYDTINGILRSSTDLETLKCTFVNGPGGTCTKQ